MFKAIIVDDENKGRRSLERLLELLKAPIEIIDTAANVSEAVHKIDSLKPNLVFMDIMLQKGTGFDVLEKISFKNFHLIFVTAFDQYALKAFRYSAIDYLTKPLDPDLLEESINRLVESKPSDELSTKLEALKDNHKSLEKLALHDAQGIQLVKVNEVLFCKSSNNYTEFHLANQKPILVSRTLKEFDELLSGNGFFRVHQSYLINLNRVSQYLKQDGGYVKMEDGTLIGVSRRKKEELLKLFN
jgi:two-component system LytT family response regulator